MIRARVTNPPRTGHHERQTGVRAPARFLGPIADALPQLEPRRCGRLPGRRTYAIRAIASYVTVCSGPRSPVVVLARVLERGRRSDRRIYNKGEGVVNPCVVLACTHMGHMHG
jgi:hypothetical protein